MFDRAGDIRAYETLVQFNARIADAKALADTFAVLDETIRASIRDVIGVSLWIRESHEDQLRVASCSGHRERDLAWLAKIPEFTAASNGAEIVSIRAADGEDDWSAAMGRLGSIASITFLPLRSGGHVVGSILILSSGAPIEPSAIALKILRGIAAHAACKIQQNSLSERLRHASLLLIQAQEAERRAISQDVHDEIGGSLNSLRLMLNMMKPRDASEASELDEAVGVVDEVIAHLRDLSFRLSPRMLSDLGLVPTARSYVKRYTARTRIDVDLHTEVDPAARFRSETESTAFRVIQESLTNVSKHAEASLAAVHLREDGDRLVVHVIDDGAGFEVGALGAGTSGIGIRGLKERVALLGGKLEISSSPGAGTRISAVLPT